MLVGLLIILSRDANQEKHLDENELTKTLQQTNEEIMQLRRRVDQLESDARGNLRSLPDTWLLSDNFLKRAFGVYGHNLLAGLIIAAILFACSLFVFLAAGGLSLLSSNF
jgi:hypothetical protein